MYWLWSMVKDVFIAGIDHCPCEFFLALVNVQNHKCRCSSLMHNKLNVLDSFNYYSTLESSFVTFVSKIESKVSILRQ